ncbi:MAG: hypothetical protein ACXVBW_08385 [Bdellovibrionota bacterium]
MNSRISSLILTAVALLIAQGCSSISMSMPVNRFESPEALGKVGERGKGSIDLMSVGGSDQIILTPDVSQIPLNPGAPTFGKEFVLPSIGAGFAAADRMDLRLVIIWDSPPILRAKYQFIGDTRQSAKAGNLSLAATLGAGYIPQTVTSTQVLNPGTAITYNLNWVASDTSIIFGWRGLDILLLYIDAFGSYYWFGGGQTTTTANSNVSSTIAGRAFHTGGNAGFAVDIGTRMVLRLETGYGFAFSGPNAGSNLTVGGQFGLVL